MTRTWIFAALLAAAGAGLAPPGPVRAQAAPAAAPAAGRIAVCPLLSKAEVKKHLPWPAALDGMPIDEEAIGAAGSSCNYPSVHVQVLPYTRNFMDSVLKQPGLERITGLGDEAVLRHNPQGYVELFVRTGKHVLTLQADANRGRDVVKTGALNLARAYLGKLR
jgi:hypothetical protein